MKNKYIVFGAVFGISSGIFLHIVFGITIISHPLLYLIISTITSSIGVLFFFWFSQKVEQKEQKFLEEQKELFPLENFENSDKLDIFDEIFMPKRKNND